MLVGALNGEQALGDCMEYLWCKVYWATLSKEKVSRVESHNVTNHVLAVNGMTNLLKNLEDGIDLGCVDDGWIVSGEGWNGVGGVPLLVGRWLGEGHWRGER